MGMGGAGYGIQPGEMTLRQMLEGLKPHDHLCLIYESPQERIAVVVPFIAIGLKRGEKCIYIVDTSTANDVRSHLKEGGVDVAAVERSGQLSILHESRAYTREGYFDPDRMIAFLIEETEKALSQGYPAVRITGEMTWVLRNLPGSERLLEYEAKLNKDFCPGYPALAICQYDRWKFDPEILKGVVMTHPLLIKGSRVYHNFYYVPPEDYLGGKLAEVEVQHWLNNLERERQMQTELRQSEERYRALTEQGQVGVVVVVEGPRIVYANPKYCEMTGYSQEELYSLTPEQVKASVHPDDREKVWGYFRQRLAGENVPTSYEYCGIRKDGRVRWVEAHVSIMEYDGRPAVRSTIIDITERKKLERALQDSEARYRRLFESSLDGILILEGDSGEIIDANPSIMYRLGYSREELQGKRLWELGFFEDVDKSKAAFEELKKKGYVRYEHLLLRAKDGRRVDAEFVSSEYEVGNRKLFQCNIRDITERKKMEEALKASEREKSIILSTMSELVVRQDLRHRILWVNRAAAQSVNLTPEELVGHYCHQIWHQSSQPCTGCPVAKARDTGEPQEGEIATPDGRRWLIRGYPVKDASGKVVELIEVTLDITERKKAEEALKLSEERYRTLVENANEAISVVQDGIIKFANTKVREISGYTVEELNAMPAQNLIHPDDRDRVIGYHERRLRGEPAPTRYEFRIIDKQGNTRWLDRHATTVTWEDKPAALVLDTDITERKQMEEALRRSEERYRTVLEEADEGYFETDLRGNMTFCGDAIVRALGYSREELCGMNYRQFLPKEEWDANFQTFNRVYRTGEPVRWFPGTAITKNGRRIFIERTILPLRNEKSEIVGFRGVARDVTERKKVEEQRRLLELRAQMASRLASVGEMAAGVAHEINNPLTGVVGYAQLLLSRQDLPEDVRRDLKVINDGAQRVAGIVQRLLAFSRQTKLERRAVNINQLIESTLALRAYSLRTNNIEVTARLDPRLPDTVADPGQIQQVLLNLIINAEQALKEVRRKGKLTITTRKRGGIIEIKVRDNGPGIKPEVMDRIFDPFFTTRPAGEGTGLGLSLCYGIVTEHNGRIYAQSKPGRGATFIVELPVVTEAPQPVQLPIELKAELAGVKILVVDDEPVIRQFVTTALGEQGCEVDAAAKAEEALEKIQKQRYHLILIDIKMPGMSGIHLYQRLRRIARSLAPRVVFVTGDVVSPETERFLSENKLPSLVKPFSAADLVNKVGLALAGRR